MTAFDVEMRETALELIEEFGRDVTWTNVTAIVASPSSGTAAETASDYTVRAVFQQYDPSTGRTGSQLAAGDLVREGHVVATFAASGISFTPTSRDRVTWNSRTWQVVALQTVEPGELPIVYTAMLRT